MSFLDKMKGMAEKANKILSNDDDDDDDDNDNNEIEVQHVDPYRGRVKLYNMGPLKTPSAPPVPAKTESLSVRIAVNGKDYGPYERATLIEMISNGSLTKETLVYMEGMTQWAPAYSVPKVKELFGQSGSVPPVPPVPWANSVPAAPTPFTQGQDDNSLSPRLNKLINAAVADGEISDMERQVLIRNAQQEGVAMDEFVMVLEAKLYERQQELLSRQREEANKQKAAEAAAASAKAAMQVSQPSQPSQPVRPTHPEVRKCPACGQIINDAFAIRCPECGYEINSTVKARLWNAVRKYTNK